MEPLTDRLVTLHQQVSTTLTNHPPRTPEVGRLMDTISEECRTLGHLIVDLCPDSRELSIALTKLQETRMFAIAALACHQEG